MFRKYQEEVSFWPSLTDLILAVLLLVLILWIVDISMRRPDKPLVFPLQEASGYVFTSGSSNVSPEFEGRLEQNIVPKILAIIKDYPIEVIEVIGHTDGIPVRSRASNLDTKLRNFQFGPTSANVIRQLQIGSNADLGLARALSVAAALFNIFARSNDPRLKQLVFRVYSGSQLISPNNNILQGAQNKNVPSRRRIELRFTKRNKPQTVLGTTQ